MFQLNSRFKVIIHIIIFAAIAVLITTILIFVTKKDNTKDNTINTKDNIEEKSIYGISNLTEKYVVYDLKTEHCEENYNIKSINGLKDKEVEKKINQKISGCKYYANDIIGNTLSFYEYNDKKQTYTYLNIRLDTGEEYNFEDIFLAESNIELIISQAINYYYSCKYSSRCYSSYDEEDKELPANFDLDEEIFRLLNIYREEGVKQFSVSIRMIDFQIGDIELFLPMESIWEDIAIYKRFLTKETIYTNESELKNYVLSSYRGDKYNGFILDNLFLEEYKLENEEIPNKNLNQIAKQNDKIKEKIVQMAKKDTSNIYFLLISAVAYKEEEGVFGNYSNIELYRINKKDYELLGGEKYLAEEQRADRMDGIFYFDEKYVTKVDIDDLISSNLKVIDKDGKTLDNYCYIRNSWEKIGSIINTWSDENYQYIDYLIDENCKLILQN